MRSINTIHVKQQHDGFFIFKFTLKHMLDNVYINKIHARQCLYIYIISLYIYVYISLYYILCCIQRNPSCLISKQLGKKDFSIEQLPTDSYILLCQALSEYFQHLCGKIHRYILLGVQWCAMCIFLFKRFCEQLHSILSRPLLLYPTYELVQIFKTFNIFSESLFK